MKSIYNYIIIEDAPLQQDYLKGLLDTRIDLKCTGIFNHHRLAYEFLINPKNPPTDIIFLDIELPGEYDGLNFLNSLQAVFHGIFPSVIITTAHIDYAVEAFNYLVSGYVLKIITKEALNRAIDKAISEINKKSPNLSIPVSPTSEPEYYDFQVGASIVRILLKDMLFCESKNVNVKIIKLDEKAVESRMTLTALETKLPASYFLRVQNSFIANMKYLSGYARDYHEIEIKNPNTGKLYKIPVGGKKFREKLIEFLESDSGLRLRRDY